MVNVTVGGSWLVEEKIGEGSFGEVFRAKHNVTGKEYAVKREQIDVPNPQLPHEVDILDILKACDYVPKCHWFGQEGVYNACVIDLLGPNLKQVRLAFDKLPVQFVSDIAVQMVTIIESIHSHGIVYRDIKPENFLLECEFHLPVTPCISAYDSDEEKSTRKPADRKLLFQRKHTVSIVDFGLASYYQSPETGQHISGKIYVKNKTGTARYASLNVHKGKVHSRRDDLESLGYLFIDLLKGNLPWAGIVARNSRQGWAKMKEMKEEVTLEELCVNLPRGFMSFIKYTRNLRFEDGPDYKYLKKLLMDTVGSGPEAEIVTVSEDSWIMEESFERPLSPRQKGVMVQSPPGIKSPLHGDDLQVGSPPSSSFYKRSKNPPWRTKNHEEVSGFGSSSRSNSLTMSSRVSSNTNGRLGALSPSRTYSLPYRDPSYGEGFATNGNHLNGRERGKRPDVHHSSHWEAAVRWNDKQQQQKDPDNWRAGLSWENFNQEADSVPTTPVHESCFWNDNAEAEWHGFDGNHGSDGGWISHGKETTEIAEWGEGKVKYQKQIENSRGYFPNNQTSKEWRDLQTRRPSTPSPLSINIPPRSNSISIMNSKPFRAVSPNNFSDMRDGASAGVDENNPLGPRRSTPNIRNNFLTSKFLKRSAPNLRETVHHQVPPPSATIQRTMAHMHESDAQMATSQNSKRQFPVNNNSNARGDEKDARTTEDKKYSPQDARYSTQDARYTGPDNRRHRERASTISYNQTFPTQDARYLPIPSTIPARQSRAYRERSYTFTSATDQLAWFSNSNNNNSSSSNNNNNGNNQQQPGAVGHSPGTSFGASSPPMSNNGFKHRERSHTFTSGGRSRDNGKNGYDRHRPPPLQQLSSSRVHNGTPNHQQQNTNEPSIHRNQNDAKDSENSQSPPQTNQQSQENSPPRAKSASPSYGHRRTDSVDSEDVKKSPPKHSMPTTSFNKTTPSPPKTATAPISILSPTSHHFPDSGYPRNSHDSIKSPTHHVTFAEKTKVASLNPGNMNSYRRQSFTGSLGHEKTYRTRSYTMSAEKKAWT